MRRDMQRVSEERNLPLMFPNEFPAHSVLATRLAIAGESMGWGAKFCVEVFKIEFGAGGDISSPDVLRQILIDMDVSPDPAFSKAGEEEVKDELRSRTSEAATKGIFGAPTFLASDSEMFWGDDRLEQALGWCQ